MVNRKEKIQKTKDILIKSLLFLIILTFALVMFIENHMIIDGLYFCGTLILFIKFLIVKLYQI